MTDEPIAIAVDWGGTWNRTAVINRQGEVLWQNRLPNPADGSQRDYLDLAAGLFREAFAAAKGSVAGIGVAVAGPVEPTSGILYQPPNLMALDGLSLKALWREAYDCPVWVGNDADLAALGEFRFGAGRDAVQRGETVNTLFYITVSTGIGGGVVYREQVYLGANGLAVELGHTTVDATAGAPRCNCGNTGCMEALASGSGIARNARSLLAAGDHPDSVLTREDEITSERVFAGAAQGDALCRQVMEQAIQGLVVGLTNAVHLFNPDLIVIGGGVTGGLVEYGLLPRIHQGILDRSMSELHKEFRLTPSRLGDSAGLSGAAALVWSQLEAPDA